MLKKITALTFIFLLLTSIAIHAFDSSGIDFNEIMNDHGSIMMSINPQNGNIEYANKAAADFYGYEIKELLKMNISDINVSTREEIHLEMNNAMNERRNYFLFTHRLAGGEERNVEVYSYPYNDGNRTILFSIIHDVTDRIALEKREKFLTTVFNIILTIFVIILMVFIFIVLIVFKNFRKANEQINNLYYLLRTFIDAQDDLVYLKDENFKYVFVNKAFKKFYGKKSSEIIGKTDYDISEKEFADVVRKNDIEALEKMTKKKSISKKDKVILESIKFPVKLLTNKIGIGTTARDVTEDVERINKIEYLSFRDSLTGLYNRRFAEEEIQRLDTDRNLPISVIIGDVNGLKLTNDVFGHHAGDALLKKVAETIKSSCRRDDIVARWGGDEFLVLLPKTGLEETEEICNRINEKLNEERVESIKCSISLGMAVKENVDKRIILVLEEAEDNMYSDKTLKKSNGKGEIIKSILTEFHKKFYREKVHSLEMKRIIEIFGKKLNLTKSELKVLEELSLYHDIGKISIDKEILDKKNPLTKSEWNEIKQHPVTGYRILNAYEDTFELASYVLSHHERWDGLGYPKGLKGKEIPKLSRVLAIVESYEVMSSEMSYVKMIDREKIIEEIENNYGKQFDPYLAKIFVEMIRNDEIKKIT